MKTADKNIPQQKDGRQTDFANAVSFNTVDEAHQHFVKAKTRLKDVYNWHNYCGPGSAIFGLTDEQGKLLYRPAQTADYFFIDLPATPGSAAGDGLEWVFVENITESGDAGTLEEYIAINVRPVQDPRTNKKEIAHFYSDVSTSTFIVSRYSFKLSAEVHGRNEKPNNQDVNLHDTIRNTAIALSARIGLSGPQWKKLIKGLLED